MNRYIRRAPLGAPVLLLAMTGAAASAGHLAAQERPAPPPGGTVQVFPTPDRGWLGIEFSWEVIRGAGEPTLVIRQVMRESPAERAGLRAGDRVRSFAGVAPEPGAVQRRAAEIRPGDEVVLEVLRAGEGRIRSIPLLADQRPAVVALGPGGEWVPFFSDTLQVRVRLSLDSIRTELDRVQGADIRALMMRFDEESRRAMEEAMVDARRAIDETHRIQAANIRILTDQAAERREALRVREARGQPLVVLHAGQRVVAGAELTPLNPDLGRYFGTESGVLTVEVLEDTPAHRGGLRGGDVIVRVGGEPVATVAAVRSALDRGYRTPPVLVTVVRERREVELSFPR